jgi:Skp family chaperone for outer membrane proteins
MILRLARAGRWFLLALIALMLAAAARDAAAAAGAVVLFAAFLLDTAVIAQLERERRQRRDASIAAMQREIDAMSLAGIVAEAERIAEAEFRHRGAR